MALFLLIAAGGAAVALRGGGSGGGKAVHSVNDVKGATVQIVTRGSFVDPEVGEQLDAAGSGSGFIVDPSGIIVTNNHVVTGSATIEVYVGGETTPRTGRVLGVSECSDLAVVDIEGDSYPYLDWYGGTAEPGLDVYAAGFPLGDPEFTLTRGIVSKARTGGDTDWASVPAVLEHDATINPGNSGGPLVTADGRVVGVNYAGSNNTGQFFAIDASAARPLVAELREGSVESVGVNGQAVRDDTGLSGIWVAGVASGTPAADVGLQGADIITKVEGLAVGADGTMADYCDILRSHSDDAPLSLQVMRYDTGEILTGELNGRSLEVAELMGSQVAEETGNELAGATTWGDYSYATDDSGTLEVEVPDAWVDLDGSAYLVDGVEHPSLTVTTNLAAYQASYAVSGVTLVALLDQAGGGEQAVLDEVTTEVAKVCAANAVEAYDDGLYTGVSQRFYGCEGTDASTVVIVATPAGGEFTILVNLQMATAADYEAADRIIASFRVLD